MFGDRLVVLLVRFPAHPRCPVEALQPHGGQGLAADRAIVVSTRRFARSGIAQLPEPFRRPLG